MEEKALPYEKVDIPKENCWNALKPQYGIGVTFYATNMDQFRGIDDFVKDVTSSGLVTLEKNYPDKTSTLFIPSPKNASNSGAFFSTCRGVETILKKLAIPEETRTGLVAVLDTKRYELFSQEISFSVTEDPVVQEAQAEAAYNVVMNVKEAEGTEVIVSLLAGILRKDPDLTARVFIKLKEKLDLDTMSRLMLETIVASQVKKQAIEEFVKQVQKQQKKTG